MVSDSPVCSNRLARPYGALLGPRLVADSEDVIESRTIGRGELVPTLRAQMLGLVGEFVEQLEDQRVDRTLGMAPRAVAFELPFAAGLMAHSAKTLRAELPVHKNKTLYSRLATKPCAFSILRLDTAASRAFFALAIASAMTPAIIPVPTMPIPRWDISSILSGVRLPLRDCRDAGKPFRRAREH